MARQHFAHHFVEGVFWPGWWRAIAPGLGRVAWGCRSIAIRMRGMGMWVDRGGICGMGVIGRSRSGYVAWGLSVDRDGICGMGISVDRGQDERGSSLHWMNERSSQSIHVQFIFITVSLP
jgi:hypothetical protein